MWIFLKNIWQNDWSLLYKNNTFRIKEISGKVIKCQIWDTAGQERYRAVVSAYYRGSAGTIVVYDITSEETFANVEKWVEEIREHVNADLPILIVGNKTDLEHIRKVTRDRGQKLASELCADFIETSAKSGDNISEAFEVLLEKIVAKPDFNQQSNSVKKVEYDQMENVGGCCWLSNFICNFFIYILK